jgi:hypothetical protein
MFAILGFLGGFLSAVFAEPLRQWLFRPVLKLEFTNTGDFVVRTPEGPDRQHEAHVVRVKVTNTSGRLAKSCRAFLINIERLAGSGAWERTVYSDSLQLGWSALENARHSPLDLPKNVPHYVDIVSALQRTATFVPAIPAVPFRYESLWQSSDTYRFTVMVSGDGVKPASVGIRFKWIGAWDRIEVGEVEPYPLGS